MKKFSIYLVLVLVLSFPIVAFAHPADGNGGKKFEGNFVTLNNSGVNGKVEVEWKGAWLEVEIKAWGLEAGKIHPQHIHGLAGQVASCPTAAADTNGDGIISIGEGLPYYGPVILSLQPFSIAPDGNLMFEAKYKIDRSEIGDLGERVVVLHGLTVDGSYIASTPIACATLHLDD